MQNFWHKSCFSFINWKLGIRVNAIRFNCLLCFFDIDITVFYQNFILVLKEWYQIYHRLKLRIPVTGKSENQTGKYARICLPREIQWNRYYWTLAIKMGGNYESCHCCVFCKKVETEFLAFSLGLLLWEPGRDKKRDGTIFFSSSYAGFSNWNGTSRRDVIVSVPPSWVWNWTGDSRTFPVGENCE